MSGFTDILKFAKDRKYYGGISLVILSLIMLPLLWMNQTGHHDWGGDFAQYIQQGINIAEGKAMADTHYIFNPNYQKMGPPAYPPGFPILLSGVYAFFGNSIIAFTVFISVCLFGCGLLTFGILRFHFSIYTSLLGALVFVYNPWILRFKADVLSDIPFTFFILLVVFLYQKWKNPGLFKTVLLGLFLGFAMTIRSIAVVFLGAIIIESLLTRRISKDYRMIIALLISTLLTYGMISWVFFPSPQETFSFFSGLFTTHGLTELLSENTRYYLLVFHYFFHPEVDGIDYLGILLKSSAVFLVVLGLVWAAFKERSVLFYFTIGYLLAVLLFPFADQGMRYLVPVIPFLLYFILKGLQQISTFKMIPSWILKSSVFLVFFAMYHPEMERIYFRPHAHVGPQSVESHEVFHFIQNSTSPESTIVFAKPRVLGLYGQRDSWTPGPESDLTVTYESLSILKANYILTCSDLGNKAIDELLDSKDAELVFENLKFKLYQLDQ